MLAVIPVLNWGDAQAVTNTVEEEVVINTYQFPMSTSTIRLILEREFVEDPRLVDVARCESRFRQWDSQGNPLRGEINPKDVGVMQINEKYWLAESIKLGHDIYTLEGNIEMAKHILKVQGINAWSWSSHCHLHK